MAFGREARHSDPKLAFDYARAASFWLTHTRRLQPSMRQALYERALLRESNLDGMWSKEQAADDYRAYLQAIDELGDELPASEKGRATHARERLNELRNVK